MLLLLLMCAQQLMQSALVAVGWILSLCGQHTHANAIKNHKIKTQTHDYVILCAKSTQQFPFLKSIKNFGQATKKNDQFPTPSRHQHHQFTGKNKTSNVIFTESFPISNSTIISFHDSNERKKIPSSYRQRQFLFMLRQFYARKRLNLNSKSNFRNTKFDLVKSCERRSLRQSKAKRHKKITQGISAGSKTNDKVAENDI